MDDTLETEPPTARGIDSFKFPVTNVNRIVKAALPPGTIVSKDAKAYLNVAATVFVSFLTCNAVSTGRLAMTAKRKTKKSKAKGQEAAKPEKAVSIQPADVLRGFEQAELGDEFADRLRDMFHEYRAHLLEKKASKASSALTLKVQQLEEEAGDASKELAVTGKKRKSSSQGDLRATKAVRVDVTEEHENGTDLSDQEDTLSVQGEDPTEDEPEEEEEQEEQTEQDEEEEQDQQEASERDDGSDAEDELKEETEARISRMSIESDGMMDDE
ncbi:hypothetical protein HDU93_002574 [Gonapodya sp. JEL0774]|nr:hypothetical protein HDU93_002574 [Gonapodya sp. JEL0774]